MPRNFYVSEGEYIGGQEPQALGTAQSMFTASAAVTKGQTLEISGAWQVAPASADSAAYCGIALNDAAIGENVTISTEGFVKLDAGNAVIADGVDIVCDAGGKVKAQGASTGTVLGKALVGCAANGVCYAKLK